MSRIAVAGSSGLVGRAVVAVLRRDGHEVQQVARTAGVDVDDVEALTAALAGVDAVIDVLNTPELDPEAAVAFFEKTTDHLLTAEQDAGVGHHVALSIVNVDAVSENAHYRGKQAQERAVREGPVPWTIVRATQFFEFAEMVVAWTTSQGAAPVAPLLVQPVAVHDVAEVLVEHALAPPVHDVVDVAGPATHDLVDMARRTLELRGGGPELRAAWQGGPFTTEMAGEVLLPGPDARIAPTTFEDWLYQQGH